MKEETGRESLSALEMHIQAQSMEMSNKHGRLFRWNY